MTFDQFLDTIGALLPLILFILGIIFKMNQKDREELGHMLEYAIGKMKSGKIDREGAKDLIIATGTVSENKVSKLLDEIELRTNAAGKAAVYTNNLIPGVGVEIAADGAVSVFPEGLANKAAHKIGKYFRKKGIKIF